MKAFGEAWDRGFEQVGGFFARSVPVTLRMRWVVMLVGAVMVGAALSLIPLHVLGTEYAPAEDDNTFEINMQLRPGTSLATTNEAAQQMEGFIQYGPDPGPGGGQEPAETLGVRPAERSARAVAPVAGAQFSGGVSSPLPGGGGGGSINVQLSGPDLNTVNPLAGDAQNALQAVPGIADVRNSNLASVPQINIQLDSQRMAELGLSNQTVDQALSTAMGGSVVTAFQPPGTQEQDITLSGSDSARYDASTLGQVPVGSSSTTAGALPVTLSQIATFTNGTGPVTIQRVNREDTVSLTATPVGRPLGDVVESGAVTANYEDGILELRLPKAEPSARRSVPISGANGDGHTNGTPPTPG